MDSNSDRVKRNTSIKHYSFNFDIAGQLKATFLFAILQKRLHVQETFAPYLYSQTECVEDNEDEHDILETSGIYHIPELILVVVLWNISP